NQCAAASGENEFVCECSEDYTGTACEFRKTEHCCENGCTFPMFKDRFTSASTRSQWCGGLNVDCQQNQHATPVCNCNRTSMAEGLNHPYSGTWCHRSACESVVNVPTDDILEHGACNERPPAGSRAGTCSAFCNTPADDD